MQFSAITLITFMAAFVNANTHNNALCIDFAGSAEVYNPEATKQLCENYGGDVIFYQQDTPHCWSMSQTIGGEACTKKCQSYGAGGCATSGAKGE